MKKSKIIVNIHPVSIFSPGSGECPVVYTHFPDEQAEEVAAALGGTRLALVSVGGVDWDRDLSPWPAPKVFRDRDDFAGGADAYLKELTENIVPAAEAELGFSPRCRVLAGYSLAGLFAVYAPYRTDIFCRVASMSGALWYDGFLDFMKNNRPLRLPERTYFSLGDRESRVRNKRLAAVQSCTAGAENLMRTLGAETVFERNSGNHFVDVPERIAKGIRWVTS